MTLQFPRKDRRVRNAAVSVGTRPAADFEKVARPRPDGHCVDGGQGRLPAT